MRTQLGRSSSVINATQSPDQALHDDIASPGGVENSSQTLNDSSVQAIQDFFTRGLLPVQKAKNHTSSEGTRPPAFWDKHLDGLQILRYVESYGNMTQQLADLTKQFLDASGPSQTDWLLLESLQAPYPASMKVKDEAGLVDYYSTAIGSNCSRIASFLLSGSQWDRPIVKWCQESSQTQSQAIADGYICLDVKAIKECSSLDPRMKENLLLVAEMFPDSLAVFEFKSLQLDIPELRQALLDVAGEAVFDWTRCDTDECKKSHFKGGYSQITCAPMGLDAGSNLPFQYPECQALASDRKRGREAVEEPLCQDNPNHREWTEHESHARHIFQQVYAEAVIQDTTFLVKRCGNHEIIGLRNREHQTLHISGVVDLTAEPAYLQIQVGLYIAAVLDAIQRALLLNEAVKLPRTWKKNWNQSRVKDKDGIPPPETLLALAHQMPQVVLHSPALYTPMDVKSPQFFRIGTEPGNSGGPVMQIIKATLANKSERTYRAILQVKGHKIRNDVYLKLARTEANQAELLHEFFVCQTLARKNVSGIPDVIGCFYYTEKGNASNDIHILAMISLGAGMPISQDDRAIPDTFIPLLQRIHDGGYLHGGIRPEHLLVDGHRTTLISMGNATAHNHEGAATEMDTLRSLLLRGRKRKCRHLFGNTEQVVVVEHTSICLDPARLFVSLILHVPMIAGMLDENTIERVLYDEHDSKSRFMIQFSQTQDPSEFVYSWLNNLPDKLRDVRCEVQDVGVEVANSYGITKTTREFSLAHLLTFTTSIASAASTPASVSKS